ncbi:hypothetical protein CARUB_v10021902mg [Capsella rubella]|uniref:Pectinesterase inhibitor domain-containing protein n=1 Tax=Capsella rubella TaxID=81985 RepID=R0GEY2_9BRAS|nr:uncharacterized protein LOC17896097 [Capsella rubella]EOA34377.1 hypothetical protein CARUB_v10021902mg [Capsella rubella]
MVSSSYCFFFVSVAFLLQSLVVSASALNSTKFIDQLCQKALVDRAFCLQTLSAYPPAVSATALLPLAEVVFLGICQPYAKLLVKSADRAAEKVPALKEPFKKCQDAYSRIVLELKYATRDLTSLYDAIYDIQMCFDEINIVESWIGRNKDSASKSLMEMTTHMGNLLQLAVGATQVLINYVNI